MLHLVSSNRHPSCDGVSRRDFLRLGALGLGGLSLPWLLQQQAQAASGAGIFRDKSVILLFLCGGPSQIETFAPNMDAPEPRCSTTGEVKTTLPGITFGGTFPQLAARAHRLAVVRSYSPHDISDHARAIKHVLTGGNAGRLEASLGAMHTRLAGAPIVNGMPPFAELIENEIEDEYRQDMTRMRDGNSAGKLGPTCAPFAPDGSGQLNLNMKLNLPLERLEDRQSLLKELDRLQRPLGKDGALGAVDEFGRQAVNVILGGAVSRALDLSKEDPRTVRRYDTSAMQTGWLSKRSSNLGKQLLLARRLCEAGCRFVTVGMAGWDNHGNEKHPGVADGMKLLGTQVDHAVSAFLDDVHDRGLSEKILLVITGEFGRTPKIEKKGGRDHWPSLGALAFAGGGLSMGQVVGRMRREADIPATEPIRLENLVATLLHALFDVGQLRVDRSLPRDLLRLVETSKPIAELF